LPLFSFISSVTRCGGQRRKEKRINRIKIYKNLKKRNTAHTSSIYIVLLSFNIDVVYRFCQDPLLGETLLRMWSCCSPKSTLCPTMYAAAASASSVFSRYNNTSSPRDKITHTHTHTDVKVPDIVTSDM
jgi:hypothetical protein